VPKKQSKSPSKKPRTATKKTAAKASAKRRPEKAKASAGPTKKSATRASAKAKLRPAKPSRSGAKASKASAKASKASAKASKASAKASKASAKASSGKAAAAKRKTSAGSVKAPPAARTAGKPSSAKAKTKPPAARTAGKASSAKAKAKPPAARTAGKAKPPATPTKTKLPAARTPAKTRPPAAEHTPDATPARPKKNVPAEAVWFPEWKQWGHGPRDEHGKRTGAWTFWRGNGSLQEESMHVDDIVHGEVTRYHPDGSLAARQRHERGVLVDNHAFLIDGKTDEQSYELPKTIRSCRFLMDATGQWQTSVAFFDAEGNRLTYTGEPVPPWPSDVPADAYLNDDASAFCSGLFANGEFLGVQRTWDLTGEPRSIAYIDEKHVGVISRDPRMKWQGHPLVAAAAGASTAAVEELLAGNDGFGLGHEPGAALIAQLEGQPELARRIRALPLGEPFAEPPAPQHARPPQLPEAASYVPGLDRWALAEGGEDDELPTEIHTWQVDDDDGEVLELEISSFEGGRLRHRHTHRGADETAPLAEEEWFNEGGEPVRKRSYDDDDDTYRERETLPSGEKLVRQGSQDKTFEEKRYSAGGLLLRVVAYDEEGRVRMDVDVAAQQGRAFDAAGAVTASGPVAGDHRSPAEAAEDDEYDEYDEYDDGGEEGARPGEAIGEWTLASGARVSVDGFSLGAAELVADLIPLLARLDGELPPALAAARDLKWAKLRGFFPLDPALIPKLLSLIALDEPAAVSYGIVSLADAIYHQETVCQLSGPVLRLMIELAAQAGNPESISLHVELLATVLTRDYDLDAAHQLKKAYRGRKGDSIRDLSRAFRTRHVEESFGEIWHALQGLREAIKRWLTSENLITARRSVYLLALLDGDDVTAQLSALVQAAVHQGSDGVGVSEAATAMAETAAFAMSLFPRQELPLDALRAAVAEKTTELASEAAKTLIRVGAEDEHAIEVTMMALRNGDTDAGTVLTLLPDATSHLGAIVAALRDAETRDVHGSARAALALALRDEHGAEDDDETGEVAREDDERDELPKALRDVLEALVDNDNFWSLGGNAGEVLSDFGLPSGKAAVVALLNGEAEEDDDDGIISAASGLYGRTVASWRDVER
jgi:hypothetical protein